MTNKFNNQNIIQAMLKISSLVVESKDLNFLYHQIHEIIKDILNAKNFAIVRYDADARTILFDYFKDEKDGKSVEGRTIPLGQGLSSYVIESRSPILFTNKKIIELQQKGVLNVFGSLPMSWMAAPIQNLDTIYGLIITQSYSNDTIYTKDDLNILTLIASHLSIVFETKLIIESEKAALKLIHKNFDLINKQKLELEKTLKDLKEAQSELIEKEKMASLGGLVAGIAHEVNTPIGICVTGASNLITVTNHFKDKCQAGTANDQDLSDLLEDINESSSILLSNSRKAAHLVSSFKMIAVDQSSNETRKIDVAQYLKEVIISLRPLLKKLPYKININCAKNIQLSSIPGAISQVLTNLIINSVTHGFEGRSSGNIVIDIAYNDGITMNYSDDGIGMGENELTKLFEPFYTTKRGFGGSGLGAHLIYNLVTQTLAGKLSVSSIPGEGLFFVIFLPNL
jgi:signal transduction histidine kinase